MARPSPHNVHVYADAEALAQAASAWLVETLTARIGPASVSLAGGSTPRRLYELLATTHAAQLAWDRVHWFFGDERFVPDNHADSNYRMVHEAMLSVVGAPVANVHAVPTASRSPEEAAAAYERELQAFYGAKQLDPPRPLFDVTLLGLGEDGHTASLFPGAAALNERRRWVRATTNAKSEVRITLTFPALESSAESAFLVSGKKKRDTLARVWAGEDFPATRLRPNGAVRWFIDRDADPR